MKLVLYDTYYSGLLKTLTEMDHYREDKMIYIGNSTAWKFVLKSLPHKFFLYRPLSGLNIVNEDTIYKILCKRRATIRRILGEQELFFICESAPEYLGFLRAIIEIVPYPKKLSGILFPPFSFEGERRAKFYEEIIKIANKSDLGDIFSFQSKQFESTIQNDYFKSSTEIICNFSLSYVKENRNIVLPLFIEKLNK